MSSERLSAHKAYRTALGKWYKWTGEKRPPKAGEWYLSGSIIAPYQSLGDMPYAYHIATEVPAPICPCCNRTTR